MSVGSQPPPSDFEMRAGDLYSEHTSVVRTQHQIFFNNGDNAAYGSRSSVAPIGVGKAYALDTVDDQSTIAHDSKGIVESDTPRVSMNGFTRSDASSMVATTRSAAKADGQNLYVQLDGTSSSRRMSQSSPAPELKVKLTEEDKRIRRKYSKRPVPPNLNVVMETSPLPNVPPPLPPEMKVKLEKPILKRVNPPLPDEKGIPTGVASQAAVEDFAAIVNAAAAAKKETPAPLVEKVESFRPSGNAGKMLARETIRPETLDFIKGLFIPFTFN